MGIGGLRTSRFLSPQYVAKIIIAISAVALVVAVIAEYVFGKNMNDCASGICWFQRGIYIAAGIMAGAMVAAPPRPRWMITLFGFLDILILLAGVIFTVHAMCETIGGPGPWAWFGIPVESYNRVIYGFMIFLILISFFNKPKPGA